VPSPRANRHTEKQEAVEVKVKGILSLAWVLTHINLTDVRMKIRPIYEVDLKKRCRKDNYDNFLGERCPVIDLAFVLKGEKVADTSLDPTFLPPSIVSTRRLLWGPLLPAGVEP
jgi:hypothetical protein